MWQSIVRRPSVVNYFSASGIQTQNSAFIGTDTARLRILATASSSEQTQVITGEERGSAELLDGEGKHTLRIEYAGCKELTLEVGEIGRLAGGAVILKSGDTVIYTNACADTQTVDGDFIPLQVVYHERLSAAGRTAGGFVKRDGRPREQETLTSRLVDRPLRPLFNARWRRETQVLQWVLSYDPDHTPQPHAITAAAASLLVSNIPFPQAVAGVQVALSNGKFIINPTSEEMENSPLDLLVAGTKSAVLMIEGFANFLPEDQVLDAVASAHEAITEICLQLEEWAAKVGKPKDVLVEPLPEWLSHRIKEVDSGQMSEAYQIGQKQDRGKKVQSIRDSIHAIMAGELEAKGVKVTDVRLCQNPNTC